MRYLVICSVGSACSDCAFMPAVHDKPRLCTRIEGPLTSEFTASTLRLFWRSGATLHIRLSVQLDYSDAAFTLTLTWADPMPGTELAHNKNLWFPAEPSHIQKKLCTRLGSNLYLQQKGCLCYNSTLLLSFHNASDDSGFY